MGTVTGRIKQIQQPFNGYLDIETFKMKKFNDSHTLRIENLPPNVIGIVVDYLVRYNIDKNNAFHIPVFGAKMLDRQRYSKAVYDSLVASMDKTTQLGYVCSIIDEITGLDNESIKNACKLVYYDRIARTTHAEISMDRLLPDVNTIYNIKTLVDRTLNILSNYEPVTKYEISFYEAYTDIIDKGDADYISKDTLWDLKTSKYKPTSDDTLQILIYYLLGKHTTIEEFKTIDKIGFINPRLNATYILDIANISNKTLDFVSKEIIGY